MQIKLFFVPIANPQDSLVEELNKFLRTQRVLEVSQEFYREGNSSGWAFCIKYLQSPKSEEKIAKERGKIDYRQVLDEATFKRFARLRELRKQIAQEESLPVYIIFTDAELAGIAQLQELSLTTLKTVKGIGEKKVEKYGKKIMEWLSE